MRRLVPAALGAAVLLVLPSVPAAAGFPDLPLPVTVVAAPCADSVTVPQRYTGLSVEWSMVDRWFGTGRTAVVPATVNLLQSLAPAGGVLRIGGNSQDGYLFRPTGATDGNTLFAGTITPGMVEALLRVTRIAGWRLVLGVNLRADDPAAAVALVRFAREHDSAGVLEAVEIGNEPNGYFGSDTGGYVARVGRYLAALDADPVTRGVPVHGPALSNEADVGYVTALRAAYGRRVQLVTWHHYANRPSLPALLAEDVMARWRQRIAEVTDAAGEPTRMDEGNSVGHGGLSRVSDVAGASAWQLDALLTGAASGLAGYNVHSWDEYGYPPEGIAARYTPFTVRGGAVQPRPIAYALALVRDLAGQQLCPATSSGLHAGRLAAWSVRDPVSGRVGVYLINKSGARLSATVRAADLSGAGAAAVSRIEDPGGCLGRSTSINGVRLGRNGRLNWPLAEQTATPAGLYEVTLQPCQSVLLQVVPGPSAGPA